MRAADSSTYYARCLCAHCTGCVTRSSGPEGNTGDRNGVGIGNWNDNGFKGVNEDGNSDRNGDEA